MTAAPDTGGAPVVRHHAAGGRRSEATYSPCLAYRYSLMRSRSDDGQRLLFVMLNPSTASELVNDPTIARCESRAWAMGYGAFRISNLFALRATRPQDLLAAADPAGPLCDAFLARDAAWADHILCAWGNHGRHRGRDTAALAILRATDRPLRHLGLTLQGQPRHPLYLPAAREAQDWPPQAARS